MIIIEHRKNSSQELLNTPKSHGVEVDLRSDRDGIYVGHDPFVVGERFDYWLENHSHKLLVLNVKEEGLEPRVRELLRTHGVSDYFFLDQSVPFLVKNGIAGHRDGACRESEYEKPPRMLQKMCDWVWLDFLENSAGRETRVLELQSLGLKVCVASPELHGAERNQEASKLANSLAAFGVVPDGVCTKLPIMWQGSR